MNHALEKSPSFGTIAWVTFILFALFVGVFTMNASKQLSAMSESKSYLEANLELDLEKQHLAE